VFGEKIREEEEEKRKHRSALRALKNPFILFSVYDSSWNILGALYETDQINPP